MVRYVAFLKGINVSGRQLVTMEEVKAFFELPGISNVSTYGQGGNVLFDSEETNEKVLRNLFEPKLNKELGYRVAVIIRSLNELKSIIKNNPFDTIKPETRSRYYVTLLEDIPAFDVRGSLGVYSNDAEYARVVGREVYIYSSNYGKTCFSNTFIEKKLHMEATTRNWSMLTKIIDL